MESFSNFVVTNTYTKTLAQTTLHTTYREMDARRLSISERRERICSTRGKSTGLNRAMDDVELAVAVLYY